MNIRKITSVRRSVKLWYAFEKGQSDVCTGTYDWLGRHTGSLTFQLGGLQNPSHKWILW